MPGGLADGAPLVVDLLQRDDDEPVDGGADDRPLAQPQSDLALRAEEHDLPLNFALATTPRQRRQAWPSRS